MQFSSCVRGGAILKQEVASRFDRKHFFFSICNLNNSFGNEENLNTELLIGSMKP